MKSRGYIVVANGERQKGKRALPFEQARRMRDKVGVNRSIMKEVFHGQSNAFRHPGGAYKSNGDR